MMFMALILNSQAAPTISNCGSSATPTYPFDFKCDLDGTTPCTFDSLTGELVCSISAFSCDDNPDEARLFAVSTGATEISVFGKCELAGVEEAFCCEIADGAGEVDIVTLQGSNADDLMGFFDFDTTTLEFEPTHAGTVIARAYGNGGDDRIEGTSKDVVERLYGGLGDDHLEGHDGDDELHGEQDDDHLVGGAGDDHLYGNTGTDFLEGGDGDDWLHGGYGTDTLRGQNHDDVLYGGRGGDDLSGGNNNDYVCDSTWPNGSTCPTGGEMKGGSGTDYAMVVEHGSCPASGYAITGDNTVEEARDTDFNWSAVTSNVVGGSSPSVYTQCSTIITAGGY